MNSAIVSPVQRRSDLPAMLVEGATFMLASLSLTGGALHWLLGIAFGWPQALWAIAVGVALTYAFRHDIKRT